MAKGIVETAWAVMALLLVACEELVEAIEPRPRAPRWQHAWRRSALRALGRHQPA